MDDELLTKREQADRLLRALFATRTRITIAEAVEAGGRLEISRRTLTYVARDLGIREVRNGPAPGFWEIKRKHQP